MVLIFGSLKAKSS